MKKANRRPRTAKGAVLIMVLTVMFVLIFLLAGTIAVVYSANNRAMKKYQESQAYYTARSVLDTYIETFLHDNDNVTGSNGSTLVTYYYIDTKDSTATAPKSVTAKQARAFELDLYDLAVDLDTATTGVQTDISTVTDADLPDWVKEYILELATGSEHPVKDILTGVSRNTSITEAEQARQIYSTAHSTEYAAAKAIAGNAINPISTSFGSYTGEKYTYTNYGNYYKQFEINSSTPTTKVKYQVPANSITDYGEDGTSGGLGKVIDKDTAATLTVEMLERKYHLGTTGTAFKEKFDNGSREKDYVKIEVTCEIYYDGQPTTTSLIYATKYDPKPSSNKAIVSLSDISSGTSLMAYGGAASLAKTDLNWTNNSGSSGNVYLQGNLSFGSTDYYPVLNKDNVLFAKGKMKIAANPPKTDYIQAGATVFAETFEQAPKGLGATGHEVNVLCKNYNITDTKGSPATTGKVFAENFNYVQAYAADSQQTIVGDVYCNYFGIPKDRVYIDISGTTATFKPNYNSSGTQYSGNDDFYNRSSGESVTGSITVYKGLNVCNPDGTMQYENIKVGDTVNIGGTNYTVAIDWGGIGSISTASGEIKLDYEPQDTNGDTVFDASEQDFTYDSTTGKRKFTLPAALLGSGKTEIEIDTPKSLYNNYFNSNATSGGTYDGVPFDQFGDFNKCATDASKNNFGTFVGDANFNTFVSEHIVQPVDRNSKVNSTAETKMTFKKVDPSDTLLSSITGATGVIDSDTMIMARSSFDNSKFACSDSSYLTTLKNSTLQNSDNYQNAIFIIDTRAGDVNLQMGDGTGGTFCGHFVVVGDNKANFLFPATSPGVNFNMGTDRDFSIYDYDLGNNPSTLRLGTSSSPTPAPNINLIMSNNVAKVSYGQKANAIQGYVYAPYTKFDVGGGNNGYDANIVVDDVALSGTSTISVIGSIFCAGYTSNQIVGVAFIDPDQEATPPGDKIFGWTDVLYMKGV